MLEWIDGTVNSEFYMYPCCHYYWICRPAELLFILMLVSDTILQVWVDHSVISVVESRSAFLFVTTNPGRRCQFVIQVGLLNVDGFYDPLLSFIDFAASEGFITEEARRIIISAPTVKELVMKLEVRSKLCIHQFTPPL